jgi:hypothetical protein
MSEKFACFPGWTALCDDKPVELRRANAVISALVVDGTQQAVQLSYRPRNFRLGLLGSLTGFALMLLLTCTSCPTGCRNLGVNWRAIFRGRTEPSTEAG